MSGWVKLHRDIEKWEWYSDSVVFRVFVHCLIRANHTSRSWQCKDIHAGSFVTSLAHLADQTSLSISKVRTALDKLKMTGEITVKSHAKYTVITVFNWEAYQKDDTQNNTQDDTQIAHKSHANDMQIATNKNEKNVRKKELKKSIYGKFKNIKLTDSELKNLQEEFGASETEQAIEYLSAYKEEKGYKNKNDNLTLRRWVFEACQKNKQKPVNPEPAQDADFYMKLSR